MPFVIVEMLKGRSFEQKRDLVKAITRAMEEHTGCEAHQLHVVIHETEKHNWGRGGILSSEPHGN
jgi:4-oxalocrotonate tautomerase